MQYAPISAFLDNPRKACHALVEKAHEEWLLNDDCTEESASYDDMTVICIFLDDGSSSQNAAKINVAPTESAKTQERKKRVRQKTLRNLEEGKEENFFSN